VAASGTPRELVDGDNEIVAEYVRASGIDAARLLTAREAEKAKAKAEKAKAEAAP
jgi:hypothetical protein